ncbi:MAG: DNA-directed RNA polymerase subunit alpha C-terminal domain-containing protein [bacterium]
MSQKLKSVYLDFLKSLPISWGGIPEIIKEQDAMRMTNMLLTEREAKRFALYIGAREQPMTNEEIATKEGVRLSAVEKSIQNIKVRLLLRIPRIWEQNQKRKTRNLITSLGLSQRAQNALRYGKASIRTINELTKYSAKELLKIDGCGPASVKEVREALAKRNLKLRGDDRLQEVVKNPVKTIKTSCTACGETGLFCGTKEKTGEALICSKCNGKGYIALRITPFKGRKPKEGIVTVKVPVDHGFVKISHEDFCDGKLPPGYRQKQHPKD